MDLAKPANRGRKKAMDKLEEKFIEARRRRMLECHGTKRKLDLEEEEITGEMHKMKISISEIEGGDDAASFVPIRTLATSLAAVPASTLTTDPPIISVVIPDRKISSTSSRQPASLTSVAPATASRPAQSTSITSSAQPAAMSATISQRVPQFTFTSPRLAESVVTSVSKHSASSRTPKQASSHKVQKPSPCNMSYAAVLGLKPAPSSLLSGFLAALDDDTDLKIKLGRHTWKVHVSALASQSSFFKAICQGNWKENEERIVVLQDDDPRIFARLLQFVYCGYYERGGWSVPPSHVSDTHRILTLKKLLGEPTAESFNYEEWREYSDQYMNGMDVQLQVYALADKYGCPELQELARRNIKMDCYQWEPERLRTLIYYRNVCGWKELLAKDKDLTKSVATKIATHYNTIKAAKPSNVIRSLELEKKQQEKQENEEFDAYQQLKCWLEEDSSFSFMVVEAMSGKPWFSNKHPIFGF